MSQKFEASFDSLRRFNCPAWFADAKLGIWSHWGPQSVPMAGDWYARNMYIEGSPQYLHHLRHYGHPSKHGYKDIVKLWKAERFDPDGLMDRYVKAGAKYFVAQAMHHDHFFNYKSNINRFNSADMGPEKDICAMWKSAANNHNLPFGLTEHLGASFSWWRVNKMADKYGAFVGVPYDGNNPADRDFYFDNYEHVNSGADPTKASPWYTANRKFHAYWLSVMKELIDRFTPDLLYSDGGLPFVTGDAPHMPESGWLSDSDPLYQPGLEAVSYLYNRSIEKHGENIAVYTQKDRRQEIYSVGILDIEKSQLPGIQQSVWQTDTCIGNWFYDDRQPFKKPGHIIEMLVDIISKNGVMLLNILQRADGTIDEEADYILKEMAAWHSVCSEAVAGTRPWRVFGEGATNVTIKGFQEEQTAWTDTDYRFVMKDNNLYAYVMHAPENRAAIIKSLKPDEHVRSVRLLGYGEVPFAQNYDVLTVNLPEKLPTPYTNCVAISIA